MTDLTTENLREVMCACAGPGEHPELDGDFIDTSYEDLGFDSLAVLELATRLQTNMGVPFPDDVVAELTTPRNVLDYVNEKNAA